MHCFFILRSYGIYLIKARQFEVKFLFLREFDHIIIVFCWLQVLYRRWILRAFIGEGFIECVVTWLLEWYWIVSCGRHDIHNDLAFACNFDNYRLLLTLCMRSNICVFLAICWGIQHIIQWSEVCTRRFLGIALSFTLHLQRVRIWIIEKVHIKRPIVWALFIALQHIWYVSIRVHIIYKFKYFMSSIYLVRFDYN